MAYRRLLLLSFLIPLSLNLACGDDEPAAGEEGDGAVTTRDSAIADGGDSIDSGPPPGMDAGNPKGDRCDVAGAECGACILDDSPKVEADCACTACPVFPTTVEECAARQAEYNGVCGDWVRANPCPAVLCIQPPVVMCIDGVCQVADEAE